jgi:hypothetical protein
VLRVSRGDAAGAQLGSYFIERTALNTGTFPVLPAAALPARASRAGSAVGRSGREGTEPS